MLFAADVVFESIAGFRGAADIVLSILLGALSIPFLLIEFGRKIWTKLKTTKHQIIMEKRENWDLTRSQALYEIDECLREIGWQEELTKKWMQYNPL